MVLTLKHKVNWYNYIKLPEQPGTRKYFISATFYTVTCKNTIIKRHGILARSRKLEKEYEKMRLLI
jgi:hypothetical protein